MRRPCERTSEAERSGAFGVGAGGERKRFGRFAAKLRRFAARVEALLLPEGVLCVCCRRAQDEDGRDGLCSSCLRALAQLSGEPIDYPAPPAPPLIYVQAAYPYRAQARTLVLRLKFDRTRAAALPLARAMERLPGGEEELIVPVPTTKRRLRRRGFNQSALLAELIACDLGMAWENALVRMDDSPAQSSLPGRKRGRLPQGCMRATRDVRGKRVLLVDDVYTTGATAGEAARALMEAGAASVGMFCATRSAYGATTRGKKRSFWR